MPFQSPRPRGRTRRDTTLDFIPHGLFQSPRPRVMTRHLQLRKKLSHGGFNPRVLAGGRDITNWQRDNARGFHSTRPRGRTRHRYKCRPGHSDCFNPRALAISQSRALAISQSRNLALSQSRNLAIMDCSLQAAGERKVKTMAKICQAETAIRGSLRVHDKRKPLNARRMPMHSFVSTPLQGTLDPME